MFGLADEQEELVRGLHHLAAAGYKAQTGSRSVLVVSSSARAVDSRPSRTLGRCIELVARDVESAGGELAEP